MIKIYEAVPTDASTEFYSYDGHIFDLNDTEKVVKLTFSLIDQFANIAHSTQMVQLGAYNGTFLLDASYSLENNDLDLTVINSKPLPQIDESGFIVLDLLDDGA